MRSRWLLSWVAVPIVAGGCSALPNPQSASSLAGCYQFRWDAGARALGLPWGVVLLDEPLAEGWPATASLEGVQRAVTATSPTGRDDHPFGFWRPTSADSVQIGHPGGGGFTLTLAPDGPDLVGQGRAVGDAVGPGSGPAGAGTRQAHPVVAHRVLCPAP